MKEFKRVLILLFISSFYLFQSTFAESPNREKATETIRILTIGNSFADNACEYLKEITESVDGYEIIIGKANIGGAPMDKHTDLIKQSEEDPSFKPYNGKTLKDWLVEDQWDVVTIQQVSHKSFKEETYHPYSDELVEYIKKYAPQAKIYIHETWAYAPDCNRLDEFGITSKEMYKGLKKNYKALSNYFDFPVLHSGDAFYRAHKANGIDLWNSTDRFHANMNGKFLAATVWFSELFGESPERIQFIPEGMSSETAEFLKKMASK